MDDDRVPDELICLNERKWFLYVLSSIFTFVAGISAVLIWRTICRSNEQQNGQNVDQHERHVYIKVKGFIVKVEDWSRDLLSEQKTTGIILETLVIVLGIVTFYIYLYDASREYVERCEMFVGQIRIYIDFGVNIFFTVLFVLRFMAASDKLLFMLEIKSCIDFFTIPPFFVSIYLQRTWIGLRCLRVLHLLSIVKVLKYLNLLKTARMIRFAEHLSIFVTFVLTTAGIFYLLLFVILMCMCICQDKDAARSNEAETNESDMSKSPEDNVVNAITHFIASSELPFAIVEQKSFKNLIETLVPGFKMPSRNTFSATKIANELIKTDLKSIRYISASLRGSTSPDRVINFTFSFISSEWELVRRTIVSRKLNASPTADDVSQLICETLEGLNIPMVKISSMTTDTCSELVRGVKNLAICHIPCLNQVINTFVDDIFSMGEVNVIMDKINKAFMELELQRGQKELNESHNGLISYSSKKRCLSKLNWMDFVRQNEMAFEKFLTTNASGKNSDLLLSSIEHQKMEFLLNFLRLMKEYIELLTDGTIVTASLVNKLKNKISNFCYTSPLLDMQLKMFVAKLVSAYPEGHNFELAEYFDPRISVHTESLESILAELKVDYQTLKGRRTVLETFLEDEDSDIDDGCQPLIEEFVLYNSRKKIAIFENPLLWWKSKSDTFPIMSRICKKYLSIQAYTSMYGHIDKNEKVSTIKKEETSTIALVV